MSGMIFFLLLPLFLLAAPVAQATSSTSDLVHRNRRTSLVSINYPSKRCKIHGTTHYRWTLDQVKSHSTTDACLMVLYDTVYEVKEFANIHRGGNASIFRNCGKDATFGYKSLQCIPGVPDHTRGVLNMLNGNFGASIAGAIKNSNADLCASSTTDPADPLLSTPDFASCPVYDALTCEDLDAMPHNGKWSVSDVEATKDSVDEQDACYTVLYNYVFALNRPPQNNNSFTPHGSGTLTFAEKHGGGMPEPILNNCWTDMTETFEGSVNRPGVPDHNRGALNAILAYLVGVIEDSNADPCVNPPPTPCDAFVESDNLNYYTMDDVQNSDTSRCYSVVLGKVYDLKDFAMHHYGGRDEIEENCRIDMTSIFLNKPFHTLVQLGAIKEFQKGVIEDSMADPCSPNYVPNPDGSDNEPDGDEYGDESGIESGNESGGDESSDDETNDDLEYYTMDDILNSDTSRCYSVVLGNVYDLKDFAREHPGGPDGIQENCRTDITDIFFDIHFHSLAQLETIKEFEKGVIEDSG